MVTIGQKLWLVRDGWRTSDPPSEKEVTVTKIGRKWFYVDNEHGPNEHRYSIDGMREDGGNYSSRARCYLSKDEYATKLERDRLWAAVRVFFGKYHRPDEITLEQLREVVSLMEIPV